MSAVVQAQNLTCTAKIAILAYWFLFWFPFISKKVCQM